VKRSTRHESGVIRNTYMFIKNKIQHCLWASEDSRQRFLVTRTYQRQSIQFAFCYILHHEPPSLYAPSHTRVPGLNVLARPNHISVLHMAVMSVDSSLRFLSFAPVMCRAEWCNHCRDAQGPSSTGVRCVLHGGSDFRNLAGAVTGY
jgi:hypothetical protein